MQKLALNFSRWFVGVLFIFSGLIKANDPLGFGYKLQEYFEVFHIAFLNDWATGIAIILCVLEIVLGALLLFGFWKNQVTKGLLGLIIFFTFLTFVSAAFKVVTSCGCFGDAIPLTPWQSFTKDLVLLVMIVYLFIHRAKINPITTKPGVQSGLFAAVFALSLFFGTFTYNYLPVIDFLPYKVGSSIPENMKIPEGAVPDEYLIMYQLKNKKTGDKACPFNSLYWHFFERNRSLLEKNPRIGMSYITLNKMAANQRQELLKQADFYLEHIEKL